jgi:hypothetical protein
MSSRPREVASDSEIAERTGRSPLFRSQCPGYGFAAHRKWLDLLRWVYMGRLLTILICLIPLLTAGCASSSWTLRTEKPDIALQWPYQPNPAKITYVMDIRGFKTGSGPGSLWHAVVYGKDGSDEGNFGTPVAVAAGRDGRIAVADTTCRCVHLYIPKEQRYLKLRGAGDKGLESPVSVIFDDDLRLYVSDSAARKVFVFGSDGVFLRSLHKAGEEELKRPTGLAYNSREKLLYVTDTLGNRIYAFDPSGNVAFSFGG